MSSLFLNVLEGQRAATPPGCIEPAERNVRELQREVPNARVISFPRGAGHLLSEYVDCVAVQGNLDPLALLAGGDALSRAIEAILSDLGRGPLIFNLGHSILLLL